MSPLAREEFRNSFECNIAPNAILTVLENRIEEAINSSVCYLCSPIQ